MINYNQYIVKTDERGRKIIESYPFDRYEKEVKPGATVAFQDGDGRICKCKIRVVKKKRRPLMGSGKPAPLSSWQAIGTREDGSDVKISNIQNSMVV